MRGKPHSSDHPITQHYYHAFLKEQPDLNWRNPQLRAVVDAFGRVLLGEVDTSPEYVAAFYGERDRPIRHLPLNYRLRDTPWDAPALAGAIEAYLGALPPHAWPTWVLGSHDKPRVASVIGEAQRGLRRCCC